MNIPAINLQYSQKVEKRHISLLPEDVQASAKRVSLIWEVYLYNVNADILHRSIIRD